MINGADEETGILLARHIMLGRSQPMGRAMFAVLACAVAGASVAAAPSFAGVLGGALGLLVLAIAAADARAFVIPDEFSLAAFLLGLLAAAVEGGGGLAGSIAFAAARGLISALVFLALKEAYFRLRHRQGIGLGDVKLAAVAGAWLDWPLMAAAIEIAALAAIASYVARGLMRGRPLSRMARLPFGLFFAPAIWLCWFVNAAFLDG